MGGIPFFFFFIPVKHGEVNHPGKSQHVGVGQVEFIAEVQAQSCQSFVSNAIGIGHKKNQIAGLRSGMGLNGGHFFRFNKFLGRAAHAFRTEGQGSQTFRAVNFGKLSQGIYFFTGIF